MKRLPQCRRINGQAECAWRSLKVLHPVFSLEPKMGDRRITTRCRCQTLGSKKRVVSFCVTPTIIAVWRHSFSGPSCFVILRAALRFIRHPISAQSLAETRKDVRWTSTRRSARGIFYSDQSASVSRSLLIDGRSVGNRGGQGDFR